MAAPAISIRNLDHLGLVAALCQELGDCPHDRYRTPQNAAF